MGHLDLWASGHLGHLGMWGIWCESGLTYRARNQPKYYQKKQSACQIKPDQNALVSGSAVGGSGVLPPGNTPQTNALRNLLGQYVFFSKILNILHLHSSSLRQDCNSIPCVLRFPCIFHAIWGGIGAVTDVISKSTDTRVT